MDILILIRKELISYVARTNKISSLCAARLHEMRVD